MKQSTFGIGIAFLLIAVGAGIRLCTEDHFFSPGNRQAVWAGETSNAAPKDAFPAVPQPLPLEAEATRLVPRQDPQATVTATIPDYLIRGQVQPSQLPPGKLTHKDISKANPLREEENAEGAALPQQLPPKTVAEQKAQPLPAAPPALPEPRSESQAIAQTALQSERQSERSGFADFPTPPTSQQDSILDGFAPSSAAAPRSAPIRAFEEPVPPSRVASAPQNPAPSQPQPSPLRSADPFAAENNVEALPPIAPAPQTQHAPPVQRPPARVEPVAPAAPVASNHSQPSVGFAQPSSANPVRNRTSEGTGLPGASVLEGSQTPHLTLEKVLPSEIILEQPATIKLRIKNAGRSTAKNITVVDRVPQGTRLLSTTPETTPDQNGELLWSLGSLDAGEELNVEMRVLPLREGEIGSVAMVNYTAEASARIQVARPMLQVDVKAPSEVRLGEVVNLEIAISNPGTATATGIVLVETIPDGLYHKDGKILENRHIDTLKPKEKKVLVLPLTCTGAGNLVNHVVVKANNNLMVEDKTTIRALSPTLELSIVGPRQRFLERKAAYKLVVSNTGTASAQNVDLKAALPKAVQFVSTNQNGVYEAQTHSVHWALEELPAQEAGEIELVVMPLQIGEHPISFVGAGQNNLKAEDMKTMVIDGIPALSFEVVGSSNLVEVGKDVTYEIRVANKGTKSASNVRIQAALSDGIAFVKADGSPCQTRGNVVAFSPITTFEAKGEKTFKIMARCNADGDHRISVQLVSDDLSSPITKEESTRVFQ